MTVKELRKWLFERVVEDSWWVSVDAHVKAKPLTLDEVITQARSCPGVEIRLLHISMSEMVNPPWVDFEYEARQGRKPRVKLQPVASAAPKPIPTLIRRHHTGSGKAAQIDSSQARKRLPVELISGVSLALALVVTLMWLGLSTKATSGAPEHIVNSREAYYQTKNIVMPYLRGDGTVSIPADSSSQVSHTDLGDGRYRVKSYARVLKPDNTKELVSYNATLKYSSDGETAGNWAVEHLQIGNTDVVESTASAE